MHKRILTIGTRGSRLALEQARRVRARLEGPSELRVIKTSGDRFPNRPLRQQQGVGFFTKDIEDRLLDRSIDLAVHSLKDLPTALPRGLSLAAVLERDEASDLLLVRPGARDAAAALPLVRNARVGASSVRRQALLRALREDLRPEPIRGNVPTRIEKLRRGEYDALVLARAGPVRLGLPVDGLFAFDLNPRLWICAPGQGVIAVEARQGDVRARRRAAGLEHKPTRRCVDLERFLHAAFGGGCHAPFGCWARREGGIWRLSLAAPGNGGVFGVEEFEAMQPGEVRRAAQAWIGSGCPALPLKEREEWISRPARQWC